MPVSQQSLKAATSKKRRGPSLKRIITVGLTAAAVILANVVGKRDIAISDVITTVVNIVMQR